VRNRFTLPEHFSVKNLWPAGLQELPKDVAGSGLASYVASLFDAALSWKDFGSLAGVTKLPILVKGIIVSNHGARQLDTTPATISMLAEIVDAVADAVEVYVDGGIRRGTDVLKAIAYGARAVLVGRPILWGLAVGGETGVMVGSGDPAQGVRPGHGAVGLPDPPLHYQRPCPSILEFHALASRFVSWPLLCPW
jgi:4-hydroxymandelate oxidase